MKGNFKSKGGVKTIVIHDPERIFYSFFVFSTLMACHTVTCRNIQHSSALLLWRQAPYSAPSAPHSGRGLAAGTRWSWEGWESLEIDVQHVVASERTFLIIFLSDERRDSLSPRSREGLSSTGLTSGDSSETRRPRLPGPSLCRPAH